MSGGLARARGFLARLRARVGATSLGDGVRDVGVRDVGSTPSRAGSRGSAPGRRRAPGAASAQGDGAQRSGGYPGDYTGPLHPTYEPHDDDLPDPGEIVWAWVPYEEDHTRGKDRPALVVGRDGDWLLALPVTSKDHDRDARQEAAAGRYWVDLGAGAWDARHRPSEARVNRVVRLAPHAVRRIGAALDRQRFDAVAAAVVEHRR